MANGRALLAALVKRTFKIEGRGVTFRLRSLADVKTKRAFPERFDWLPPDLIRRRAARIHLAEPGSVQLNGVHHAYQSN